MFMCNPSYTYAVPVDAHLSCSVLSTARGLGVGSDDRGSRREGGWIKLARRGHRNAGERGAVSEGAVANVGDRRGDGDAGERGAAIEGAVANLGDRRGDGDAGERVAS